MAEELVEAGVSCDARVTVNLGPGARVGDISIYQSAQDFRNSMCILLVGTNMAESLAGSGRTSYMLREREPSLLLSIPDDANQLNRPTYGSKFGLVPTAPSPWGCYM